jgi:rubrerythrin
MVANVKSGESRAERAESKEQEPEIESTAGSKKPVYLCDRCGFEMFERNCKVVCPNCGSRYDCSDLNIHFD